MAKINFYHIEDIEKEAIFEEVAAKTGMTAFTVEKDWWWCKPFPLYLTWPLPSTWYSKAALALIRRGKIG